MTEWLVTKRRSGFKEKFTSLCIKEVRRCHPTDINEFLLQYFISHPATSVFTTNTTINKDCGVFIIVTPFPHMLVATQERDIKIVEKKKKSTNILE